jgi:cobalt/nickel transport system permease protein
MHIPDAAISPATSLAAGAAMLPVWYAAGRRLRATLSTRQVPLLAIGAAFCFTVMMFNIPVPGGTTVHPVGGALLAVLLGPWAAVIGMTVALVIQALFFADGGVFAVGANSFTMAFAMPFCGYFVYRLVAARAPADSPRRALAAGFGAYLGINAAALLTALLLGLQPALFHDAAGRALYFPFGLKVALPAMLIPHLTVAGMAEAVVTVLAVRYLQAARIPLYGAESDSASAAGGRRELLWAGLGVLAALSPLGLLARGDAWGEGGAEGLARQAGYLPKNLAAVEAHGWKGFSLLPDYLSGRGPVFYILAAVVGIMLVAVLLFAAGRLLARRIGDATPPGNEPPPSGGAPLLPGEIPVWMLNNESRVESREARVEESSPFGRQANKFAATTAQKPALSAAKGPPARTRGRVGAGRLSLHALRRDFLEKTLADLTEGARETVFGEKWARRDGLLQRLDPRAKIAGLFGFVVLTACLHRAPGLALLFVLALALAALSRIPPGMLLKRVWLTVPLFVGAVTLPAALNIVTPGPALLVLWRQPYLAVTAPGLAAAGLLTLRVGVAVSFVTLLTLTTRWNDLLRGLRVLLVPRLFLVVLAMTYRYLAVLMQAASEMFTARRSRTVGRAPADHDRRFLGGAMGALFGRTLALTDEVHAAMLSRGWTGEARALRPLRLQAADVLWLGAMAVLAAIVVGGEVIGK